MVSEIPFKLRNFVMQRDNFKCQKCGFIDNSGKELEVHHIIPILEKGKGEENNLITLCSICHSHAPDSKKEFLIYISEKIDGKTLSSFRKSNYSVSQRIKKGMIEKFSKGIHITKAPKGYKLHDKILTIDEEEAKQVKEIFNEFLNNEISLTQLGKKFNMTTAGIKKLLQNTTYMGKVKFANIETEGNHEALLDKQLFEQVQEKIKKKFGKQTAV